MLLCISFQLSCIYYLSAYAFIRHILSQTRLRQHASLVREIMAPTARVGKFT